MNDLKEFASIVGIPAACLFVLWVGACRVARWFAPQIRAMFEKHFHLVDTLDKSTADRVKIDEAQLVANQRALEILETLRGRPACPLAPGSTTVDYVAAREQFPGK